MTMTTVVGWHNDTDLKVAAVTRMRTHRDHEEIIKGTYGRWLNGMNRRFAGCFHGCLTIETLAAEQNDNPVQLAGNLDGLEIHKEGERLWGIPARLGRVLDTVFEAQPDGAHAQFAVDVTEAIPAGADLSLVVDRWLLDILADDECGVWRHTVEGSAQRAAVLDVAGLYQRRLAGDEPARDEWTTARRAAYDADVDAADAAAYAAADAAAHTVRSAAYAAYAADAAAHADADAANARRWQAQRLIHHIANAPKAS